jgi:hypothetical protein
MNSKQFASILLTVSFLFAGFAVRAEETEKHKPTVGDIQDKEVDRINRRVVSHQFSSFGFGPFGSSTSNEGGVMYGLSYGKTWEANETGEIRLDFQGAANSKQQFFSFGLGYGYIPLTGDFSPLLGFELGGGAAGYRKDDEHHSAGGFSGGLLAGMRMFRTSDTQLELMTSYHAVFAKDTPGIFGLQLRILY